MRSLDPGLPKPWWSRPGGPAGASSRQLGISVQNVPNWRFNEAASALKSHGT